MATKTISFSPNLLSRFTMTALAMVALLDWSFFSQHSQQPVQAILQISERFIVFAIAVLSWGMNMRVQDDTLSWIFLGGQLKPRQGVVPLDEVHHVFDDSLLGLHWFHIINDWQSAPVKKRIMYTNWFMTRHKDFLRLVVSRVRPGTHVDESILKRVGFTQADIGKDYKKPISSDSTPA